MWLWLWITMLAGELQSAPVDFETQVMPILTKAGCNTGPVTEVRRGGVDFTCRYMAADLPQTSRKSRWRSKAAGSIVCTAR